MQRRGQRREAGRARPTRRQIQRRRLTALVILGLACTAVAYLALTATVLAPSGHGSGDDTARLVHIDVQSRAVGRELGVNVIVPEKAGRPGHRWLMVMLHGRGGSEMTFNDAVLRGLADLHGHRAPVYAFPAGGVHGYWHDRPEGGWGTWVMKEALPLVIRRFGIDPHRVAIGGISMGGFGAYDLALKNPGRFCAVAGHSPALWLQGSETAPGAFEDGEDFEANDVIGAVEADPGAFGNATVWIDYGTEDPFRPYDEAFTQAMEAGDANFSAHSWPGGHEGSYWAEHWPRYQRFYLQALSHCGA